MHHRIPIVVLQNRRIKITGLSLDDVFRKPQHLVWQNHLGNLVEVFSCVSHFMIKAQGHAAKTITHWLYENWALARREDDTAETHDLLVSHGVADHREGFRSYRFAGNDVIRLVEIARVDLRSRKEPVDLDGPSILRLGERHVRSNSLNILVVFVNHWRSGSTFDRSR